MVTRIGLHGVTLSANATENGFPRLVTPFRTPRAGDYAKRPEGQARRRIRRARIADKRAFLAN